MDDDDDAGHYVERFVAPWYEIDLDHVALIIDQVKANYQMVPYQAGPLPRLDRTVPVLR